MKLKIKYVLMQWCEWYISWNVSLYCKIIISFLELFSVTCFLCILLTQLTTRNTSVPKKHHIKRSSHEFHDDVITWLQKWHLPIFLPRLTPYCQYSIWTKFHVKWTQIFWDTSCFFIVGLLEIFNKAQPR